MIYEKGFIKYTTKRFFFYKEMGKIKSAKRKEGLKFTPTTRHPSSLEIKPLSLLMLATTFIK
jgi:hypothetical protein